LKDELRLNTSCKTGGDRQIDRTKIHQVIYRIDPGQSSHCPTLSKGFSVEAIGLCAPTQKLLEPAQVNHSQLSTQLIEWCDGIIVSEE
jgi:hypothetical protein